LFKAIMSEAPGQTRVAAADAGHQSALNQNSLME
jgi:hypothetical protein